MPRDKKTGKRIKPSRPREVVKAELLADPNTKKIANSLHIELEAYVEKVLDYAYNPDKEVQLKVASDEELRALGYEPPSPESVGKWIRGAATKIAQKIAVGKKTRSGFEAPKEHGKVLGKPTSPTPDDSGDVPEIADESLKEAIKKNRRTKG